MSNGSSGIDGDSRINSKPPADSDVKKKRRIRALQPPNNNLGEDELLMKTFYDLMQIKSDRGEWSESGMSLAIARAFAMPFDQVLPWRVLRPLLPLFFYEKCLDGT